jgi:cytochrome c biogenesis protein CcmG/thiol:disulfide interchange protein DsbE
VATAAKPARLPLIRLSVERALTMKRFLLPLALFLVLVVFLGIGLNLDPREVPSPFIGKPAPAFQLSQLKDPAKTITPKDLLGKVWLLNVWSSWCISCRREHPVLVELAKRNVVPIIGLNYKEVRGDGSIDAARLSLPEETVLARQRAEQWLAVHGNPYQMSVLDIDGRVGIDYGVYGVPETFVIDKGGTIRFKQTGPITTDALKNKLLPLIRELNAKS